MHDKLYELKDKLLKELSEYAQNGKYSKEDVETIKYMASAIDHMCNVLERMEDGYSSYGGGSYRDGGYSGDYRNGRSYHGGSYGSYARNRSQEARRDSMGRYSRASDPDELAGQLEDLMRDAPNEHIKGEIQRLVKQLEQM